MEVDDETGKPQNFMGASAASTREVRKEHVCQSCNEAFVFYSCLACVDPFTKQFAMHQDTMLTSAMETAAGGQFRNKIEPAVVLNCYKCLSAAHGVKYADEHGKLTSSWMNKQKATKRSALPSAKLDKVLKAIDEKTKRTLPAEASAGAVVSVEMVYRQLAAQESFRSATDFVQEFGEHMSVHYGCLTCFHYPLRSNGWWRTARFTDTAGQTMTGGGKWRCACCSAAWSWGDSDGVGGSSRRLLAIGTSDNYFVGYIGKVSAENEAYLTILKGVQLLKQAKEEQEKEEAKKNKAKGKGKGKDEGKGQDFIDKELLLKCIDKINNRTEKRLLLYKEAVVLKSCDIAALGCKVYCEDDRLSMCRVGQSFRALLIDPKVTPTLLEHELREVIELAAAFLPIDCFEAFQPVGPAQAGAFRRLAQSSTLQQVRLMLERSRI
jgi:hypothetical protein